MVTWKWREKLILNYSLEVGLWTMWEASQGKEESTGPLTFRRSWIKKGGNSGQ